MSEEFADTARIKGYHAHVYYSQETRDVADRLRAAVEARFPVTMGRWRDEPVGPHPVPMYQIAFANDEFARLVPWLMLNREGLDVLVHPETGDNLADHSTNALWLGTPQALRLEMFRKPPTAA